MQRYTIAILVHNRFGVLNRVTSMFRRRQFNINTLTVSETETNKYSRITVLFEGDLRSKNQLVDQLYKLPDVVSIKEFTPDKTVSAELLLIKMENTCKDNLSFDETLYGVGIRSVIATATKYEGMYDFSADEGVFYAKISLNFI